MVELLGKKLGREPLIKRMPPQPGDVPFTWADISKARDLAGYEPKVSIEEGLHGFVDWFRSEGAEVAVSAQDGSTVGIGALSGSRR